MKKLLLIIVLFATCIRAKSQDVSYVLGSSGVYFYRPLSIRNTPLFNREEISSKKISSCMIVHPTYSNSQDTICIFNFDRSGNIEREIRFYNGYMPHRDTSYGPRRSYYKEDSTIEKTANQKIVTKYCIWAFNWQDPVEDTSYIKRYVYDAKDRLTEFKMNGTPDFFKISFCGTGITYYNKFVYDDNDRVIFYQDMYSRRYATFEHHKRRCIMSVYDSLTHTRESRGVIRFDVNDRNIIEIADVTTTLTRLHKGSNLFSRLSTRENGKGNIPSDYFLIYEYFDNLPPKEKLIVVK